MHFFRLASVFSLALVAVAQDISIRAVKRAFNAANVRRTEMKTHCVEY
jgi:hypothetical protein